MDQLEARIGRLEQTVEELRAELRTLRELARTDCASALNKIRFITEKILSQLCKEHGVGWGTKDRPWRT